MDKLLSLLEENARLTNAQLAVMLDTTEAAVAAQIEKYEQEASSKGIPPFWIGKRSIKNMLWRLLN